jgi:predicted DNA-binding transcriptional regulator AlpA
MGAALSVQSGKRASFRVGMGAVAQIADVSPELAATVGRVISLTTADQLQLFELLRERLSTEVAETNADRKAQARAEALKVLAEVADCLGKPGEMPTPDEFDVTAASIAPGWNRSRVVRAWGKWRFAKTAYLGGEVRTTGETRKLLSAVGAINTRSPEIFLAFVRKWLDTNPPGTFKRDYQAWVKKYNETLKEGDDPAPSVDRIYAKLRITWEDVVRVARGEISLAKARPTQARDRKRVCQGPHDLVSITEIQEKLGCTRPTANTKTRKPGFPVPVFSTGRVRLWMREDVEAYLKGEPFPKREEDELGDEYLRVIEVADRLGVAEVSVASYTARHLPRPTVNLGGVRLWHVSVIEETLQKRTRRGRMDRRNAPVTKLAKLS